MVRRVWSSRSTASPTGLPRSTCARAWSIACSSWSTRTSWPAWTTGSISSDSDADPHGLVGKPGEAIVEDSVEVADCALVPAELDELICSGAQPELDGGGHR